MANGRQGNVDLGERKLSVAEQLSLEGRVTLGELTLALNKSNMNSACGWDGVSYWLLKKYWEYSTRVRYWKNVLMSPLMMVNYVQHLGQV